MIKRVALAPISYLYLAVVKLRHYLFDHSFLKSERFTTPIICVGNITVGGTGKSPMSELLLSHLIGSGRNVALLSRGYGRKNRGYVEVCSFDNYLMVGDEPLQMKRKFHDAVVVVCERRVEGVRRILSEHPDVEVIVMDDGFQHRHITPRANIIMVDATRPIDRDMPLPSGSLRDTTSSLKRADIFIVTKCPDSMGDEEMERIERSLLCREGQTIYFTQIETLDPRGALPEACESLADGAEVIALSGIANPKPFVEMLHSRYRVVEELIYGDHHRYTPQDTERLSEVLTRHPKAVIITTEKDSVKFLLIKEIDSKIKERLYYTPIKMRFIRGEESELLKKIDSYVGEN